VIPSPARVGLGPLLAALTLASCEDEPACEEDPKAQILDERVSVSVAGRELSAELADELVERERGWKHRVCDREALLIVPDTPDTELGVWGCGLVEPVDAWFVDDGIIVDAVELAPCAEPCGSCAIVEAGPVDAVLETPAGELEASVSDSLSW
jgi:uncharacterized membrane protein (UPF0127 family)